MTRRIASTMCMDPLKAEIVGRRVAIALTHGNAQWAHAIIDSAFNGGKKDVRELTVGEKLLLPVLAILNDQDEVEIRMANILDRNGIQTVGDLLTWQPADIIELWEFGEISLQRLYAGLERIGFTRSSKSWKRWPRSKA